MRPFASAATPRAAPKAQLAPAAGGASKTKETERPGFMKFSFARTMQAKQLVRAAGPGFIPDIAEMESMRAGRDGFQPIHLSPEVCFPRTFFGFWPSIASHSLIAALFIVVLPSAAQTPPPATQQQPGGQVIFSRSTDANGQTTTTAAPAVAAPKAQLAPPQVAEDSEREAVTFTDFDMDLRLLTAEQHIAVRALITVRNDGKTPLTRIPLQISSSLNWERIRINGKDAAITVATVNSDADHTGQLHEAARPARPAPCSWSQPSA